MYKYQLKVNFVAEKGYDAGGLKREFFDLIGIFLKDFKLGFFKKCETKEEYYFFQPAIQNLPKAESNIKILGSFFANAIFDRQFIGIDFIPPFWKYMFEQEIGIQDLKYLLDQNTYNNYLSLKTMNNEDLELIGQTFSIQDGDQLIELIPGGSQIILKKENVDQYLNSMADHLLVKKYKKYLDAFKQGFQEFYSFELVSKYLEPQEIERLTSGIKVITYEILSKVIEYENQSTLTRTFFKQYLAQSSEEILKSFVQFTTGSSKLPYETKHYKIRVTFVRIGGNQLPIAHTCSNEIEMPYYRSFDQMKAKLDMAFTYGNYGYGFD